MAVVSMLLSPRDRRTATTTNTTTSATTDIVPASRLVVVCDPQTRSVLQEIVGNGDENATEYDGGVAGDNSTNHSHGSAAPVRLDWGGMAGGNWDQCDDWDAHRVSTGGVAAWADEIRSRRSVADAVSPRRSSAATVVLSQGVGFAVWLNLPHSTFENSSSLGTTEGLDEVGDDDETPIFSLARPWSSNDEAADNVVIPKWKECGEAFDVELSYRATSHEFLLRYSDVDGTHVASGEDLTAAQRTCRTLRVPILDVLATSWPTTSHRADYPDDDYNISAAVHVAVLWSATNNSLHVYGQGRAVRVTPLPQSLNVTLSQWNLEQDHLVMFRGGTFGGGLHQADVFVPPNLPESGAQVADLYQQGFVKSRYRPTDNSTGANNGANAWLQLDILKIPSVERLRIAQDSTAPLTLSLGGMVRWKRNISAFGSSSSPVDGSEPGRRFSLRVNITRIPTHGIISLSNVSAVGSQISGVGSVLVLPLPVQQVAAASLDVDYSLTDQSFYNLPLRQGATNNDEELLEATIYVVWKGETVASSPVVIPIQVQQVNSHPPVLMAPTRIVVNETDGLPLSNVSLHDPDAGSGWTPVRVDVSSRRSPLDLALGENDDALTFTYDTCQQRSESPWQCVGGGGDREGAILGRLVTFVAPMEDVPRILQSMVRVNLLRESDAITIRVYDGQDDADCLSAREHAMYGSNWTLHRGCFVVEANVELVADPGSVKEGAAGGTGLDTSSISRVANLMFWGLTILLVLGIVACLRRCMPRCLARGSCCGRGAIDADDGSVAHRVEAGEARRDADGNVQSKDSEKEGADALDTTMSDDEFDDVASF